MERGSGLPLVLGNILFTIIAIVALRLGGWSGVATVGITGVYFVLSSMAIILTATGGLRDVLLAGIQAGTRILEIMLIMSWRKWQARQGARIQAELDRQFDLDLELEPPQELMGVISSDYRTFVSAVPPVAPTHEQATRQQARAWLVGLFDEKTGELDRHKVFTARSSNHAGWLRERAPVGDVRSYLLSRGAIRQVPNGYALNLDRIGTLRDVDGLIK